MKTDLQLLAEAVRRVSGSGDLTLHMQQAFRVLAADLERVAAAQKEEMASALRQAGG